MMAARGGEGHLDSKPRNQNRREHAKEVLTHSVEEAEILRQHVVDGLIDELQKIRLHRLGSFDDSSG